MKEPNSMTLEEAQKQFGEMVRIERTAQEKLLEAKFRLFKDGLVVNENAEAYSRACSEWEEAKSAAETFYHEYHGTERKSA